MATTIRKKAKERGSVFSSHTHSRIGSIQESGITALGYQDLPSCHAVLLSLTTSWESPICYFNRPKTCITSHHINEELSCVAHRHAQRLAWSSELGGCRGELSARWGARRGCRQVWGLGGQARGAVNEARPVGYGVRVGAAVADRAADAALTGGSHRALARSSVAPDLRFAATATGLPTLVFAAVWTTASCGQRRRPGTYYPSVTLKI